MLYIAPILKENIMENYRVSYWYRDLDEKEHDYFDCKASSPEEAIQKMRDDIKKYRYIIPTNIEVNKIS